jgi:hypothetical protein
LLSSDLVFPSMGLLGRYLRHSMVERFLSSRFKEVDDN